MLPSCRGRAIRGDAETMVCSRLLLEPDALRRTFTYEPVPVLPPSS